MAEVPLQPRLGITQFQYRHVDLIALDAEGVIAEATRTLTLEFFKKLDFCEVGLKIDVESDNVRHENGNERRSVPLSERYTFVSYSNSVRRILATVAGHWLDLSPLGGAIIVKHADLFNVYRAMQQTGLVDDDWDLSQELLKYMASYFKSEEEVLSSQIKNGIVSFLQLPYLFQPQEKLVVKLHEGTLHGSTMRSCEMRVKGGVPVFHIRHSTLSYDGKRLGRSIMLVRIPKFDGSTQIHDLAVAPLRYHPEENGLRDAWMARGQTYLSIIKEQPCMYHNGSAFSSFPIPPKGCPPKGCEHEGPVLLGCVDFNDRTMGRALTPVEYYVDFASHTLSPEDLLDSEPYVPAYMVQKKQKMLVRVQDLREMSWPTLSLEGLTKESGNVMRSLVKGLKGLKGRASVRSIILLRGPEGDESSIHTISEMRLSSAYAEVVASQLKRPLLTYSKERPTPELQDMLEVSAEARGVIHLDTEDWLSLETTRMGQPSRDQVLDSIRRHDGLIFVSVDSTRNLDPRFLEMVDHVLERETNNLVGVERRDVERWLRFLSDGAVTEEMVKNELQRRIKLRESMSTAFVH